ncbi:type I restriction-modification system specificity subunit S [Alishewanella aestuarii B11]|uniref:Type I restriction-modification system specificity subunit S n=1 Tax=Alishewanella aestuarii B11 TaxID=1197174 RepID=J1YGH5_9ALTE|nr:restriction endonuclease subunit S [Alishewanella aestuarii]EJI87065.1 type I restriction-modification system specificity subunit S [Alishewanella aestuarii B11]
MAHNQKTTVLDSFVDPRAPICYGILKPGEHVSEGIPVIKVKNIIGGRVLEDDLLKTSLQIHNQYKRAEVNQGDLLLTIRGTTGRVAIVPASLAGANITQDTARIRVSSDDDPMYVFYALQSPSVQQQIDLNTVGQAVKGINIAEVRKLKIFHPDASEQKKIVQILSTWDKAITTTEQLLANSLQQKKALMQQLLTGKKRLLDKNGVRFSGEWKVSKLSKLFARVTTKNNGQSTNVVTISGQHGLIRQEDFFKKTVASETLDGYFLLKQGQFAYNKSYSNGYPMGAIKRLNRYPDGVVTTLYICFELSDSGRADSDFWEHYFESGLLNKGLSQIAHEGGRAHGLLNVKPSDFFSLKVSTPSFEEQQRIAAVLSTADQEISALQQKLDALKQEKKALMQQLLTGKLRVLVS